MGDRAEARRAVALLLAARTLATLASLLALWRCYQAGCSLIPRPIEVAGALSGRITVVMVALLGFIVGLLGLFLDSTRIPREREPYAAVLMAGAIGLLVSFSILALSVSAGSVILVRISLILLAWALTFYAYGFHAMRSVIAEEAGLAGPTWLLALPLIGGPVCLALLARSRGT
ncbi:MAG: hypothetical protein F7C34_01340 [Desulfurococcales archaeon]|nr:hypothetical protein [Desulfurococcales archaeon]